MRKILWCLDTPLKETMFSDLPKEDIIHLKDVHSGIFALINGDTISREAGEAAMLAIDDICHQEDITAAFLPYNMATFTFKRWSDKPTFVCVTIR